jgi:hypothetical protein
VDLPVSLVFDGPSSPALDLAAARGSVPPGLDSAWIPVRVLDDARHEPEETVRLAARFSSPSVGRQDGAAAVLRLVDDDPVQAPTTLVASPAISVKATGLAGLLAPRVELRFAARLTTTADGAPLPGKRVVFASASGTCAASTAADGWARCSLFTTPLVGALLQLGYAAVWAGDATSLGTTGRSSLINVDLRL